MTELEDRRVRYLIDACAVKGHLGITPDDLSLILTHQYELGKEAALADLTEHDKEIRNKTIEDVLQTIRKGMSELLESPWASNNYMCNHDYAVCNTMEIIDDLILKKDIEQMKEGAENG